MFRCSLERVAGSVDFLKCWDFSPFFLVLPLLLYLFGFGFVFDLIGTV